MRGLAISQLTLASDALLVFFLVFLWSIHFLTSRKGRRSPILDDYECPS